MSSVAEQLRQAREQQHLTVEQVADLTKIKSDHIRALEEGYYDRFAAPVYIRGFVRSYAGVLGMPVPSILGQLDDELAQTAKFRERPSLIDRPRGPLDLLMFYLSRLDWRKTLAVAAAVIVMVAGFRLYHRWQSNQQQDPLAGIGPGIYRPPANTSAEVLPLPDKGRRK